MTFTVTPSLPDKGVPYRFEALRFEGFSGGRNRTRTCDPIDVNDVLYQLSHATMS